jgi:hypothetical protein
MRRIRTALAGMAAAIAVTVFSCPAWAESGFEGDWWDPDGHKPGRFGDLSVTSEKVVIKNLADFNGDVSYSISLAGDFEEKPDEAFLFDKEKVFKVSGVDIHPDPEGCSSGDSINYIAFLPYKETSDVKTPQLIEVLFYGSVDYPI